IRRAQSQNNNNTARGIYTSVASSSGFASAGSGENTTVAFIPTGLRRDLIELLDMNIPGSDNWEMLAEHLGHNLQFIRWLDRPRNIESPTEKLLMEWENKVTENPEDALRNLENVLWKMKRHDAATKIQMYLDECTCSIKKETTV
ncbi:Netrin receptor UNC5C, partial [Paramuricea clavata]